MVERFFEKKESFIVTEIYFALLAFTKEGYTIKQIFNADFGLTSKLLTLGKIIFSSASSR